MNADTNLLSAFVCVCPRPISVGLTQRGVGKVQPSPQTTLSGGGGRLCRPPPPEKKLLGGSATRQTARLRKSYSGVPNGYAVAPRCPRTWYNSRAIKLHIAIVRDLPSAQPTHTVKIVTADLRVMRVAFVSLTAMRIPVSR